jgi:hypothetical protein
MSTSPKQQGNKAKTNALEKLKRIQDLSKQKNTEALERAVTKFQPNELAVLKEMWDKKKLSEEQREAFQYVAGDLARDSEDDESDNDTSGRKRNGPNLKGFVLENDDDVEFFTAEAEVPVQSLIVTGKRVRKPVQRFAKMASDDEIAKAIGDETSSESEEEEEAPATGTATEGNGKKKSATKDDSESEEEEDSGDESSDEEYKPSKDELDAADKEIEDDVESDDPTPSDEPDEEDDEDEEEEDSDEESE